MKRFLHSECLLCFFCLVLMSFCAKAQVSVWDGKNSPWTKGSGTATDPFLIENAQQLAYLAYRVNNGLDASNGHVSSPTLHYKLMVDVDLNGSETFQWTPIGYYVSNDYYQCFGGNFDGNGHTVSGLYINSTAEYVGFFGFTSGGSVKNLSVKGDKVATTGSCAGGIIGRSEGDNKIIVSNSYSAVAVSSNYYDECYSGGIIGYAEGTIIITNCYNSGNVFSGNCSGGIIGYGSGYSITILNCRNTGFISSTDNYSESGGIIGCGRGSQFVIRSCCNYGDISSEGSGGIIGGVDMNKAFTITNCCNTGNVFSTGTGCSGGIIAETFGNGNTTIINCYNTGNVSSTGGGGGGIMSRCGYENVIISNCYNTGNISSGCSGGIVASSLGNITISNCYNTGNLSSNSSSGSLGGIIGGYSGYHLEYKSVNNCHYLSTCGGSNIYGGFPKTATDMRNLKFVDTLNQYLDTIAWKADYNKPINNGYPILKWQEATGITGIGGGKVTPSLSLYPNPTEGNVTVSGTTFNHLQLFDMNGKLIETFDADGESFVIDLSRYASSIYVIRAWNGTHIVGIGKVMKQ